MKSIYFIMIFLAFGIIVTEFQPLKGNNSEALEKGPWVAMKKENVGLKTATFAGGCF